MFEERASFLITQFAAKKLYIRVMLHNTTTIQSSGSESVFLEGFFSSLNKEAHKYAVMRNYEQLPKSVGGSDVDLLVDHENPNQIIGCIVDAIKTWSRREKQESGVHIAIA